MVNVREKDAALRQTEAIYPKPVGSQPVGSLAGGVQPVGSQPVGRVAPGITPWSSHRSGSEGGATRSYGCTCYDWSYDQDVTQCATTDTLPRRAAGVTWRCEALGTT